MSDKTKKYWALRCARWGDFEMSGRAFSCTNWHRLINGTPPNQLKEDSVKDLSEQVETAVFIRQLDDKGQALAKHAFASGKLNAKGMEEVFLEAYAVQMERMRKQRLNGEPLDPLFRKKRPRIAKIKIDRRTVAATAEAE